MASCLLCLSLTSLTFKLQKCLSLSFWSLKIAQKWKGQVPIICYLLSAIYQSEKCIWSTYLYVTYFSIRSSQICIFYFHTAQISSFHSTDFARTGEDSGNKCWHFQTSWCPSLCKDQTQVERISNRSWENLLKGAF